MDCRLVNRTIDGYYEFRSGPDAENWEDVCAASERQAKIEDLKGWGRWTEAWAVNLADGSVLVYARDRSAPLPVRGSSKKTT
jgi:hypothetical protein